MIQALVGATGAAR